MAKKGGKASKGKGPSKPKPRKEGGGGGQGSGGQGSGASKGTSFLEELAGLPPQERIATVRPFWESLTQAEREELLSVPLEELRAYARKAAERLRKQAAAEAAQCEEGAVPALVLEPSLEELLEEAVRRSADKGTWKVWQWPSQGVELYDSDAFRRYLENELIPDELRRMLPREEGAAAPTQQQQQQKEAAGSEGASSGGQQPAQNSTPAPKPVEKPAEAALRLRMADLLQRVHAANRAAQEEEAQYRRPVAVGRRGGGGGGSGGSADPHAAAGGAGVRDVNIDLITMMMNALEKEHEFLYHLVLYPLTTYLAELLPEGCRDSSRTELFFEDLEKLPPEEVARICEWLTEKLDSFSSKLKPEAKELEQQEEEEEEPIGDVDLFCLTRGNSALTVHPKWLNHLQERQLGEDGQPRKVKTSEDPHRLGLVLEWVYGTIVSTAEKARDGAKRALGSRIPQVEPAHEQLVTNLRDLASWDARARTARELLAEMVQSRKEAAELAAQHNIRPYKPADKEASAGGDSPAGDTAAAQQGNDTGEGESGQAQASSGLPGAPPAPAGSSADAESLPDAVMLSMLRREVLLTRAKLHYLSYQQMMAERTLRSLKAQLRQGEPEFDRLKREVEEVKSHQRGLEGGSYRSAAELERHRAALADAAIEEQIEVQTAFRETGQRLQRIYDHRRETELNMARREQEMKQLSNWKGTVVQIITQLEDTLKLAAPLAGLVAGSEDRAPGDSSEGPDLEAGGQHLGAAAGSGADADAARALVHAVQSVTQQTSQLAKLRSHFHKDIRRQLYSEEDDLAFFDTIKRQLKEIEKRMEDGRAALQHVENFVVNVACDDPGASVGAQLVLPLLQERLDVQALQYAAKKAEEAQAEVIRMEAERAEREKQEREKKAKQKQKAKDKLRSEKERERAEREVRERAEREQRLEQQLKQQAAEEEERRRRAEELEALRKAEEELMERRRQELMADEGSHWRQRMEAEKLAAEQAQLEMQLGQQVQHTELSDSANEAELPDSFQPGTRDPKRRQQQGARRRGGPEAEEGAAGSNRGQQQPRHSPGTANGYLHPHQGGLSGANGPAAAGERGARVGRGGREGGRQQGDVGPRQERSSGPQNRAVNLPGPPGSRAPAGAARGPREQPPPAAKPVAAAALPSQQQQQQQPAALDALQPATASSKAGRPAAPVADARAPSPSLAAAEPSQGSSATAAPGPADFPPLPASSAPVRPAARQQSPPPPSLQQQQQQLEAPQQPALMPHDSGGPTTAAAALAPAVEATAVAVHAAPAAAPAPAVMPAPPPPAAAAPAAALPQPIPGPASVAVPPVPLPVPIPPHGMPAMVPPPGMVPMVAMPQGVPPPHMPPPHMPAPAAEPAGQREGPAAGDAGAAAPAAAAVAGPERLPASAGPHPPPMPVLGAMPPPPFVAPFPPMPGAPLPPQGPMPIMYFPAPPPPQMMGGPPGRGPRPGAVPFVPMPGMFPMMPIPVMHPAHPGMPMPMQQHGSGAMPGVRPSSSGSRARSSGTSLRVTAQPFVPSTYRGSSQAADSSRQEGASAQRAAAPVGGDAAPSTGLLKSEEVAAAVELASASAAGSSGTGSPRGPLEVLPASKSSGSAASSTGGGVATPDEGRSDDSSSSTAGSSDRQQPQQQGFHQPPLPTTTAHSRGGQQPAAGAMAVPPPAHTASMPPCAGPTGNSSSMQQPQTQQPLPPLASLSSGRAAAGSASNAARRPEGAQVQAVALAAAKGPGPAAQQLQQQPQPQQEQQQPQPQQEQPQQAPPVDLQSLKLVRGLTNAPGLYNCFLNVVVQCLWHLAPFRRALLALPAGELEGRGGAEVDVRVMQALWRVFHDMDAPHAVPAGPDAPQTPVSAAPLREALSGLRGGMAAAAAFELSEMHDAAEVLGEMFDSMHRAQLGAAAVAAGDPTLPRRVRVAAASLSTVHTPAAAASGGQQAVYVSERDPALSEAASGAPAPRTMPTVWANGTALAKIKQAPQRQQQQTTGSGESLVIRLFGQEVQAPEQGTVAAAQHAANSTVEVLQYVKYFHLVPALGLRAAYDAAAKRGSGAASHFEELLLCAEAGAHHSTHSTGPGRGASGGKAATVAPRTPLIRLLRRPQIMALGLVWESPQAPTDAIAATMQAIGTELDVGGLFAGQTAGPKYDLRCIMCYQRSHYQAFALSEEVGQWLQFDDAQVSLVGGWASVVRAVVEGRMQPSVLFYETRRQQ